MRYHTGIKVTYRNKVTEDRDLQIAFGVTKEVIIWMGFIEKYGLAVVPELNSVNEVVDHYLHILPHAEGYNLTRKTPKSPMADIFVAYNKLSLKPDTAPGELTARRGINKAGAHGIIARLPGWKNTDNVQDTLFGLNDRLILPHTSAVAYTDKLVGVRTK